jgi:hypothetical protein
LAIAKQKDPLLRNGLRAPVRAHASKIFHKTTSFHHTMAQLMDEAEALDLASKDPNLAGITTLDELHAK